MVERGAFTLSLDTELAWGSLRRKDERAFDAAYPRARETALRLLDLLARHGMPATWAIVGHLFLASSDAGPDGAALRAIADRPAVRRGRPGEERSRPLLYASEVVSAIASCPVPQEIGCHSFAHERADRLTADEFRRDLRACAEVAAARGIRLRSFVFPWNVEAHHDVLASEGYLCYRVGVPPREGVARAFSRARGFAGELLRANPPTVWPRRRADGLWAVPPSMFLVPRSGWRRLVPLRSRLERAIAGLEAAAADGRAFHLWFHPFNLTTDPEGLFGVLDLVLARAAALRDAGRIDLLTMAALAERAAARP